MQNDTQQLSGDLQDSHNASLPLGLISQQEIVDVDVPAHKSKDLHAHIMGALAQKPAHRIVSITMTTYGEFPLYYRVLVVIEYV